MNRILIRSLATQTLALIAFFSLAVGCQARQSSSATSDTKQWTIEGDVMDGTQPVPGASVWWGGPGPNRTVESDGRGHYVLSGSNRARAWVNAEKDGYCDGPERMVSAEPGARVEHMDLVIHKEGIISGRVLDPEGNGLEGAEVDLYEKIFKEGKPSVKFTGSVGRTNDLGEYRIAGVCAGPSFLFAAPPLSKPHKLRPSAANRHSRERRAPASSAGCTTQTPHRLMPPWQFTSNPDSRWKDWTSSSEILRRFASVPRLRRTTHSFR